MEIWDAYDENFNIIEGMTLIRGEEHLIPEGVFHLVVDILVKHTDGTYLLMQRDLRKHYPGMWEASAGGSALKGETPYEGAVRELKEETGIESSNLTEIGRIANPKNHSAYVDFFCITDCAKDSIVLQEGETIDYRWVTEEELFALDENTLPTLRILNMYKESKRLSKPK